MADRSPAERKVVDAVRELVTAAVLDELRAMETQARAEQHVHQHPAGGHQPSYGDLARADECARQAKTLATARERIVSRLARETL